MTDFAWLIEAPGPRYLEAVKIGRPYFRWTADPQAALRLWSEDQADKTMMAIREMDPPLFAFEVQLGNAWARQHGFLGQADQ